MSDPKTNDPTLTLARFIFKLGRETEQLYAESKALVSHAYDMGYQAGRADVKRELGVDDRALLVQTKKPTGGTGAPAAN